MIKFGGDYMVLKYYSSFKKFDEDKELLESLYDITKSLEKDYPNHYNWFHNKFINELDGVKREIIFCSIQEKPVGVIFLKNDENEKKICTLIVSKDYRGMGIGTLLIEESFNFLGTQKPLITMPEHKEKIFMGIINKYNWTKTQVIESCYSENTENVYNSLLMPGEEL